ncbi:hypothetical protein [Faecalibacterium sp. An122]|uniref:hypothetical protein n=1 Tax=Faecalibacterium sp. An122 TaxID=1965551 RepID=UPI000B36DA1F|nr:hypothetical protein [Faecalibacterium sp. An122]OUQ38482.1 hypothetical protein B5E67_05705 [Faecalibacterium sp. An122]
MLFLGGCGYTMVPNEYLLQLNGTPSEDQEGEEETVLTEGTRLRNQMIAVLNLGRDLENRISSSTSLDEAASLFLEIVLEDPETYILSTQQGNQNQEEDQEEDQGDGQGGGQEEEKAYLYVYDGDLSSGSVATLALKDITEDEASITKNLLKMASISVTHGSGEKGSVWVILVEYIDE